MLEVPNLLYYIISCSSLSDFLTKIYGDYSEYGVEILLEDHYGEDIAKEFTSIVLDYYNVFTYGEIKIIKDEVEYLDIGKYKYLTIYDNVGFDGEDTYAILHNI